MEVNVEIDEITNCLVDANTGDECETEYRLIRKRISKSKASKMKRDGWNFDWSKPQDDGSIVYELTLKNDKVIQGLVALQIHKDASAVYVEIVESAPHNRGKRKKYVGVGPHLFAIACKLSFNLGYDGIVYFISKTELLDYYIESLNAKPIGNRKLLIDTKEARLLTNKYFKEG